MTVQDKNIAWCLPRPKPDHYKGGMPLYAEEWLLKLAGEILNVEDARWDASILNLFCGMNKYGIRVDLNPEVKPDIIWDAHDISNAPQLKDFKFDIILADPPYSKEESKELYGMGPLNYKRWTAECDKFLKPGGLLVVYHKFVPANPNPDKYSIVKRVAIFNRVWHLPRVAIFFQKDEETTARADDENKGA
jgi:hypothetical protein